MKQKIGIYPGTFDPIHAGHLAFALATLRECHLDRVVFLPEANPRGKTNVSPLSERVQRITDETGQTPHCTVKTLPMERFNIAKTMPQLALMYPNAAFVFLIGSDVVKRLHAWPQLEDILGTVTFAIGLRDSETRADIDTAIEKIANKHGVFPEYTLIVTDQAHVASSKLRA